MLKTNVDKLLNILKEKKQVMISDLASTLNTTPSNIEKIAKMLEEEKLVTIRYKMMKPYLVYGFKGKKKKGKKKPLFVWKKKKQISKIPQKPIPKPKSFFSKLFKKKKEPVFKKPVLKPQPKKILPKPLPKVKKSFFSKLFKKKIKPIKPTPKPFQKPLPKVKKSFFSKLFKKKRKPEQFKDIKEELKKSKGIRLEKKPIKSIFPKKFQKPVKFKEKEKKKKIETEDDVKNEIDNLVNECKKQKDKNLIKRNYKKALALYSRLKQTDNKMEYNKKIKDLYNKLTK